MAAESRLLYDTRPLVVNPKLAELIGLEAALVLHQIHYWVNINRTAKKNYRDGYFWTFNTFTSWKKDFPFWSVSTIKRIVKKLEDDGLIIAGRYNLSNIDRTKWYRIDHIKLIKLESRLCQSDTMDSPNPYLPLCQSDTIDKATESVKLTPPIPETNKQRLQTETNCKETSGSSSKNPAAPKLHSRPIFAEMQKVFGYPETTDKDPIPNYGKEAKAIDRMLKRGYSEADILGAWKKKVKARGEFVSMVFVNEDIGKPDRTDRPRQSTFALPAEQDLVAQARERGLN
jgi:hypothetical protein